MQKDAPLARTPWMVCELQLSGSGISETSLRPARLGWAAVNYAGEGAFKIT